MPPFEGPKEVRQYVRAKLGLGVSGRIKGTKKDEYERQCKKICAKNGWADWKVRKAPRTAGGCELISSKQCLRICWLRATAVGVGLAQAAGGLHQQWLHGSMAACIVRPYLACY